MLCAQLNRPQNIRILAFAAVFAALPAAFSQGKAEVELFTPQGTVKGVRQVRVRFTTQMVPFGRFAETASPFEIVCPVEGQERWADGRNWIFDFKDDLPAGVRCEFSLRKGLKNLAGAELGGKTKFNFSTGGPAVRNSRPYEGYGIDEDQAFVLDFDAPVDPSSIKAHLYFSVQGMRDRIEAQVITGEERKNLLKAAYGSDRSDAGENRLVIRPRLTFPAGSRIEIVAAKGLRSKSGVPTDIERRLRFQARAPLTATFYCDRENEKSGCIPILPFRLVFSAPILRSEAKKIVLRASGKGGQVMKPSISEDEKDEYVASIYFTPPFPEMTELSLDLPAGIKDDAGRPLGNRGAFPLKFRTEDFPPLAKFAATFGIIESKAGGLLPVTLRNIEASVPSGMTRVGAEKGGMMDKIIDAAKDDPFAGKKIRLTAENAGDILRWLTILNNAERDTSILAKTDLPVRKFSIPKPDGAKAFEVVGIPLSEPGFYIVEIESRILGNSLLGENKPMYVPSAALVTNLAVHFKQGRESSLAWVTTLDQGRPVASARVSVRDCRGRSHFEGVTDQNGVVHVGRLPSEEGVRCAYGQYEGGFLITAESGNDLGFVHTSWDQGIEPWRFNVQAGSRTRAQNASHTVFDRTLFRAGEAVHMKHVMRTVSMNGLRLPGDGVRPSLCRIKHRGTDQDFDFPLTWNANGTAEVIWRIPKNAKLGEYSVELRNDAKGWERDETGSFRVEEFRIPLMRAVIQTPVLPVVGKKGFDVDLAVSHLSGGGAGGLNVRLKSQVIKRALPSFEDYEEFSFAAGRVKEGVQRRAGNYYYYAEGGDEEDTPSEDEEITGVRNAPKSKELTLDPSGTARSTISDLPALTEPFAVLTEMEYQDPNGEIQTVSRTTAVWPSAVVVGLKPDSWVASSDRLKFHAAVLGLKGTPVAGTSVTVTAFTRKTFSHRKRLVGGFYAYENVTETKKLAEVCSGKTDARGLLICDGKPPAGGALLLEARAKDANGNESTTFREIYVAGRDDWWSGAENSDRMDLIPEKKQYETGEKARFQVRMPFRNATALVTVEREGILESFVLPLQADKNFIEIPIRPHYAPNVYISALVIRGRAGEIQPTALVDLGRPSFRLGLTEIKVGRRPYELKVKVKADKETYSVRQKASITVEVVDSNGKPPPKNSEVAIAAVDEGLLELQPNGSWDLLDAMMGRRSHTIDTSTAQMQVVGRRHFGRKALNPGGGGGKQTTRELFDTLLLWKASVKLDADGRAQVEIPLNDSLTSFKIVAVAQGGESLFGTGSTSIRTTQDLMLLAGLPPLSREGDKFKAQYTLRNTTSHSMNVEVRGKITGLGAELEPLQVDIGGGESKLVGWDLTIPYGVSSLVHEVEAREGGKVQEKLKVTTQVIPAVPVRIFQATLSQLDGKTSMSVERPPEGLPGRGGVTIDLRPSLTSGLSGVRDVMRAYPYSCMEQQVSVAVSLRDPVRWERTMSQIDGYLDDDGLVKFFPLMRYGSDFLTAYVLAIANEAGWEIPDRPRTKMIAALTGFVEGRIVRGSGIPTADLAIRKISAIEALSRYNAAKPSHLESLSIDPNIWPTSTVIDWLNILGRMPVIAKSAERREEAQTILRSRLNFQGTIMQFSRETDDRLWWLMVSSDLNATRLILSVLNLPGWKEDMPRMVRGIMSRQKRGAWDLTLANAWGVLAVEKFAAAFEKTPVKGTTEARLGPSTKTINWSDKPAGDKADFDWPASGPGELSVEQKGSGKPWLVVQSRAAVPLKAPFSSGYQIEKTMKAVEKKSFTHWSPGDIIRVTLKIRAQSDMTWVVVNDPIPGGASILGSGLKRDSSAAGGERSSGYAWPAFQERAFDGFRSYYEYVAKGDFTLEYTLRLNQAGTFQLPATRVEAMYSPEMFGEIPNEVMSVSE